MGANPIEGSSNNKRSGTPINARAIASICCSPPDSVPASWLNLSFNLGKRINCSSTFFSRVLLSYFLTKEPTRRFSMTVNLEKIPLPSGTNVIPFVARSLAFVLVISRFLNFIDPPELCFRPDSPFSKVVLPAPFAPIMAKKDPLFSVKVKFRTATIPP